MEKIKNFGCVAFLSTSILVMLASNASASTPNYYCYIETETGQIYNLETMCRKNELEEVATSVSTDSSLETSYNSLFLNRVSRTNSNPLLLGIIQSETFNPYEDGISYCQARRAGLSEDELDDIIVETSLYANSNESQDTFITYRAATNVLAPQYLCPDVL